MGQGRCQLCPCAPAREPPRLPLDPASRLGLLTGAAGRMGQAQRPRPFRLWELGLPGRFLGTSSLWHSVCAFNVQGGAEHGHFDAAAVFRAAPAATFPIVAAVAAAERAAERAAATKASAAVQAGAVTLAAQETGRAGSTSAGTSAGTGTFWNDVLSAIFSYGWVQELACVCQRSTVTKEIRGLQQQ